MLFLFRALLFIWFSFDLCRYMHIPLYLSMSEPHSGHRAAAYFCQCFIPSFLLCALISTEPSVKLLMFEIFNNFQNEKLHLNILKIRFILLINLKHTHTHDGDSSQRKKKRLRTHKYVHMANIYK